jgi:hypothetical protein
MRPYQDGESGLWMTVENVVPIFGKILGWARNVPRGTFAEAGERSSFRARRRPLFHVEHFSANCDYWPLNGNIYTLSGHFLLAEEKNSAGICWSGLEC